MLFMFRHAYVAADAASAATLCHAIDVTLPDAALRFVAISPPLIISPLRHMLAAMPCPIHADIVFHFSPLP